jgi:hypothetical protein
MSAACPPKAGLSATSTKSAGTNSDEAMLFGASDLASLVPSPEPAIFDRERRHWRARSVPSMTLPFWSSIWLTPIRSLG